MSHPFAELRQQRLSVLLFLCCTVTALIPITASAQDETRSRTREKTQTLPLPSRTGTPQAESGKSKSSSAINSLLGTTISLGLIVSAAILAGRWMKRNGFRGTQSLPVDAFEVLGRRALEPKVSVHLVRLGSRILLLGTGSDGVRKLSEIDDPAEVEQLLTSCQLPPIRNDTPKNSDSNSVASASNSSMRKAFLIFALLGSWLTVAAPVNAQPTRTGNSIVRSREVAEQAPVGAKPRNIQQAGLEEPAAGPFDPQSFTSPQQLGTSLKMLVLMTVFSLAPSILMMTTCFVRLTVVLGLLRQALGTQQGPPNQVLTAICLFLTAMVMSPVWQKSYQEGIRPYTSPIPGEQPLDETTALTRTLNPIRQFMSHQIDKAGNADAVWMLLDFQRPASDSNTASSWTEPKSYDDIPFLVLAPAYLLSELKVGFLIGFQLFLPFLVIDFVVAMTLATLGLNMMPPSIVSLPFKLLLFVLIDGWFLTVGMLLESIQSA